MFLCILSVIWYNCNQLNVKNDSNKNNNNNKTLKHFNRIYCGHIKQTPNSKKNREIFARACELFTI